MSESSRHASCSSCAGTDWCSARTRVTTQSGGHPVRTPECRPRETPEEERDRRPHRAKLPHVPQIARDGEAGLAVMQHHPRQLPREGAALEAVGPVAIRRQARAARSPRRPATRRRARVPHPRPRPTGADTEPPSPPSAPLRSCRWRSRARPGTGLRSSSSPADRLRLEEARGEAQDQRRDAKVAPCRKDVG